MLTHQSIEKMALGIAEAEDSQLTYFLKEILSTNILPSDPESGISTKQICVDGIPRYEITTTVKDGVASVRGRWLSL